MTDKYAVEVDNYDEGEAEYDAADYPARVMDVENDEIVCLCRNQLEAKHIIELLKANPFPFGDKI